MHTFIGSEGAPRPFFAQKTAPSEDETEKIGTYTDDATYEYVVGVFNKNLYDRIGSIAMDYSTWEIYYNGYDLLDGLSPSDILDAIPQKNNTGNWNPTGRGTLTQVYIMPDNNTPSDGSSSSDNASLDVADRANVTVTFTAKPGYVFTENGKAVIIKTVQVRGADATVEAPDVRRGSEEVTLTVEIGAGVAKKYYDEAKELIEGRVFDLYYKLEDAGNGGYNIQYFDNAEGDKRDNYWSTLNPTATGNANGVTWYYNPDVEKAALTDLLWELTAGKDYALNPSEGSIGIDPTKWWNKQGPTKILGTEVDGYGFNALEFTDMVAVCGKKEGALDGSNVLGNITVKYRLIAINDESETWSQD